VAFHSFWFRHIVWGYSRLCSYELVDWLVG
jgi:hypothetical protein